MSWLAEQILEVLLESLRFLWRNVERIWRWAGLTLGIGLIVWFFVRR